MTTAAQQVVLSFAVAGLTGYLTSQIASHTANAGADANPLNAVVAGYGDTFFLSACLTTAGVALSLLLRKPPAPGRRRYRRRGQLGPSDDGALIGNWYQFRSCVKSLGR
ncbi:hypothetical protein MJ749_09495 [Paenibacillus polymyxa]|uniref:hypothetical protein n=1 Tax=Paenibacillus polymyxa TaxID=1406 RepID=UPI001F0F83E6|nr:hypothetical protein [Paenibacillus polymyxa]UMR37630.1 hypothetical protein MJ749_09495 [Paenibacillus polymyxa]